MPRRSVCVSLALFACAPKPPADTEGDATTTSTASSDGATSTGSATSSASSAAATPTTATSDDAPGSTEPPDGSTGAPDDLPVSVYVVESRPSEASGVDGLERWQPDPFAEWCEGTTPCVGSPVLGAPKWFVDGQFADPSAIHVGSRVALLLPFAHPGCALACGFYWSSASDEIEGGGGGGSLPADLPCRTAAQGVWLALDFGVIVRDGPHQAALRLEDRCGNSSEPWVVTFEPGT